MSHDDASSAVSLPFDVRLMRSGANVLLLLLVLVALGYAAMWAARLPQFNLREIHVEGEVLHNSGETIRRHAAPLLKGNYLTMDLRQARTAFESVPWVRRAEVRRVWPHDLIVRLEEHRPVAYWSREEGGDDQLVNTFGEVFEVNLGDVEDDGLPVLRGPKGSTQEVLAMWKRLVPEFARMKARIERLSLSDRGSWQVRLDHGAVIEVGRGEPDDIVARTQRFILSVEQITRRFENRAIEYADLRHSESYALRLAGVGTMLDAKAGKKH